MIEIAIFIAVVSDLLQLLKKHTSYRIVTLSVIATNEQ
jgi:hypothetical protein